MALVQVPSRHQSTDLSPPPLRWMSRLDGRAQTSKKYDYPSVFIAQSSGVSYTTFVVSVPYEIGKGGPDRFRRCKSIDIAAQKTPKSKGTRGKLRQRKIRHRSGDRRSDEESIRLTRVCTRKINQKSPNQPKENPRKRMKTEAA